MFQSLDWMVWFAGYMIYVVKCKRKNITFVYLNIYIVADSSF